MQDRCKVCEHEKGPRCLQEIPRQGVIGEVDIVFNAAIMIGRMIDSEFNWSLREFRKELRITMGKDSK